MFSLVRAYFFVFGLLSLAGGVMGFVKAKSQASLIAGGVAGVLLLVAGYLMGASPSLAGPILGMVLCLALAGRFVPAFVRTKKVMPAGMMAVLSVVGALLLVLLLAQK
jgi:uncharacterized membrane protein (UPF0136 family)